MSIFNKPPASRDELFSVMASKIPVNFTKTAIGEVFECFGAVADVHIPFDKVNRRFHDYGFVRFYAESSMKAALSAGTIKIGGETVIIGNARPSKYGEPKQTSPVQKTLSVSSWSSQSSPSASPLSSVRSSTSSYSQSRTPWSMKKTYPSPCSLGSLDLKMSLFSNNVEPSVTSTQLAFSNALENILTMLKNTSAASDIVD